MKFQVTTVSPMGNGHVYVALQCIVEDPKTEKIFANQGSTINLYLQPDAAKKYSVGQILTLSFK